VSGKVTLLHPPAQAIPRLSERVVARPRVTDALVERIERFPVVQVIAPAGSGKTTAVAQAVGALDRSVVWLTLEEWHRSLGRLVDEAVDVLEQIAPGLRNEIARARADAADNPQLAAVIGSLLHRHHALLVIDDCHVLQSSTEASALLPPLVRRGAPGLHIVLIGRVPVSVRGLGVEALDPDATVGDDLLRATHLEAAEVMRAHSSRGDVDDALQATGGWIAGLVFESWSSSERIASSADPLATYLKREVRPRLDVDVDELLVASSVFTSVDIPRARALGVADPGSWLASLREAGVPATWSADGLEMRLHPRIREVLRAELAASSVERRRATELAAAEAYEQEGRLEDALVLYLDLGEAERADVLVPAVLPGIVERQDVELAERLLESTRLDPEPPSVVLARLMLASLKASFSEMLAVVNSLWESGRLTALIAEEPAIGAFVTNVMPARSLDEALEVLDAIPPGRASDVARLMLSVTRDDPDAPFPPFTGDALDAVLARALYCRGHLRELRVENTYWAESTGVQLLSGGTTSAAQTSPPRFMRVLTTFNGAVASRDLEAASACTKELRAIGGVHSLLADAELAVRLEREPERARDAIEQLRASDLAALPFYREQADTWDGGARLLADDDEGAAEVLREATASMRRGDRILVLPAALVYLAESEWRLGNEEASDRATDEAYDVAHRQGSLRELLLALADFPGVLSRRLDAEPETDGPWHSLGRALVAGTGGDSGARVVVSVSAHLREFGEPVFTVNGRDVRPKIRKSIELLSFMLLAPGTHVSREAVLTALWNGRDDDSTRAYLRQALRHLRDVLPEGVAIGAVGDSLSIEGAVTSESIELEALLSEAAREPGPGRLGYLLDALELTRRGLFLEGSSDVLWVDDRRARIERVLADARLDAAELLLEAERHLRALTLVDEALDADPLLERAWRLRMRTLDLLGDKDGVTSAYAACTRALAEIGLEPSAQTRELAQALRR
jgi:DNA-binding SARP family transcriptional activator